MSNEIERLEQVEKYVRGEMTGEELSGFESRLQSDPTLRDEIDIFKDIMEGAELFGKEELAAEIRSTHQELKEEGFFKDLSTSEAKQININRNERSNVRRIGMGKWWALAAGMALVIVAGYFVFKNGGNPNAEEVFAQIYEPENKVIDNILDDLSSMGMAGADDPHADSLAAALKFYKVEEYDDARNYLADLVQKKPEDYLARLYLGLSLLQQGDYNQASRQFKVITQVTGFRHKDVADWYLALSYLGFNSDEGLSLAKEQMKKIANNPESNYQKDAADALAIL